MADSRKRTLKKASDAMALWAFFKGVLDAVCSPGSSNEQFACCDLVDQENLFTVQDKLLDALAKAANAIGPVAQNSLKFRLPACFDHKEVRA